MAPSLQRLSMPRVFLTRNTTTHILPKPLGFWMCTDLLSLLVAALFGGHRAESLHRGHRQTDLTARKQIQTYQVCVYQWNPQAIQRGFWLSTNLLGMLNLSSFLQHFMNQNPHYWQLVWPVMDIRNQMSFKLNQSLKFKLFFLAMKSRGNNSCKRTNDSHKTSSAFSGLDSDCPPASLMQTSKGVKHSKSVNNLIESVEPTPTNILVHQEKHKGN